VRHHVTCFWAFFVEHHLSMMHELLWCYAPWIPFGSAISSENNSYS
jgi:hypothetical protein